MLVNYQPPGEVSAAFHASNAFVRGLKGPVGSGKSSSCCIEVLSRALEQEPGPDGVRRSRSIITRNTYPELKSTTIKTWMDWFGDICVMKYDTPITGLIEIKDIGDGTGLWHEAVFLAIDRPDDVGKLKSLEGTFGWMNEASEMEKVVLDMLTQRVGRFPAKRVGGPTWTGVFMDTNPPDDDHWWYKLAEEKPEGYLFLDQPGGLQLITDKDDPRFGQWVPNPLAENVENLPGGYDYYLRQLSGKTDDYIKVFLGGLYGTTMDGKPVYPEWNEKIHLATETLKPIPGIPITMAFDFGLTPACVFLQMNSKGQLMVLRELVSEDMGIRQFYSNVVLPYRNSEFPGFRIEAVGDPAGNIRAQTNEKTCMEELLDMGLVCEPADSNEFIKRRESVAYFLQLLAGGQPAFIVDPSCKSIRKGFNGGYRYERLKTSGPAAFKDRPAKDRFSHPHDALQYGCMKYRSGMNPVRARPVEKKSMRGWV